MPSTARWILYAASAVLAVRWLVLVYSSAAVVRARRGSQEGIHLADKWIGSNFGRFLLAIYVGLVAAWAPSYTGLSSVVRALTVGALWTALVALPMYLNHRILARHLGVAGTQGRVLADHDVSDRE